MQQIIDCPIRRRLAHLPWANDGRAGARHWLEMQRDPLAWLQKMHVAQPDLAVARMGPQRLWCLFHPQAVQELMVDRRDDLQRWQPALCMLKQWNGRSFMMREGAPPRPGARRYGRTWRRRRPARFAAWPRSGASGWRRGANTTSTWKWLRSASPSAVTRCSTSTCNRRPIGSPRRCACCRGWHCWK